MASDEHAGAAGDDGGEIGPPSRSASVKFRDRIKGLRRVRAADLRQNPKNWRKHPNAQRAALRGVLEEVGHADALLVRELADGSLMIIDGHLRAGLDPDAIVPVLVLDVTEEEADLLLLTLDPLAAMAEPDFERIKTLLSTVHPDNDAIQELLRRTSGNRLWEEMHPEQVREVEVSADRADELRRKWRTEPERLYRAGLNLVMCGDSTDESVVARVWNGSEHRFRTLWCDPPYGVSYADENEYLNAIDRGNRVQKPIANDHLPTEAPAIFSAALRVAVPYAEKGASVYATAPGGPLLARFIAAFDDSGFSFKSSLVWVKQQFVIGRSDYHFRHEHILYGWIENGAHYFTDDRTQDSVFEVDKPHVSALHPTSKPVELIAQMIKNSTRRGDLVYDPFLGSGSTVVAAHQLGRIGYGCEVDPAYVAVALERLSLLGLKPEVVEP
jgi:DNA modification methylase